MSEKVDFTGVQSTMLVTLYLRALDDRSEASVLGDHYATEAVERIEYDWDSLASPTIRRNQFGVALRSRQFDEWTTDFLRRNPDATVVQLACGMDTRAFRLDPPAGTRWYDVDLPDVIELRRRLYADSDGYRMIGSSVTDDAWLQEIPADRPTLILAEGLLMYLHEPEVERLLRRLTDRFPSGELVFDGWSQWVARTTQVLKKLMGRLYGDYPAYWTGIRDPRDLERWNPRLRYREHVCLMAEIGELPGSFLSSGQRRFYGLFNRFGWFRDSLRVFRGEF